MSDEINLLPEEFKRAEKKSTTGFTEDLAFHLPTEKIIPAGNGKNLDLLKKDAPNFFSDEVLSDTKKIPQSVVTSVKPEIKSQGGGFWKRLFTAKAVKAKEMRPEKVEKKVGMPILPPELIIDSKKTASAGPNKTEEKRVVSTPPAVAVEKKIENPIIPNKGVVPTKLPTIKAKGGVVWWRKIFSKSTIKPEADLNRLNDKMSVNLIPDNIDLLTNKQVLLKLINPVLAAIFLVALVYAGLFGYGYFLNKKIETLVNAKGPTKEMLAEDKKIVTQAESFKKQLATVETVVKRHIYWTKFLAALEEVTADDVFYGSMSASPDGRVTLEATAPSYTAVARQFVAYLNSPKVLSVSIPGANGSSLKQEVKFGVELLMQPEIYFHF